MRAPIKKNLFVFALLLFCGPQTSKACVMQGADIVHCAPEVLSEFLFAPFSENDCDDDRFLKEAREEYLGLSLGEKEVSKLINGKSFIGAAKDLETLKEMVSHGRVPEKVKVALEECDEVLCALDKAFGSREASYRALSIARDSGYVVSFEQIAKEDDYIWSLDDLRDISYVTNILPERLMRQSTMDRFKILPPRYYFPEFGERTAGLASPSYNGNGAISFKNFDRSDKNWPSMVIVHEMAHHFDYPSGNGSPQVFNRKSGFFNINGWEKKEVWVEEDGKQVLKDSWSHSSNGCFPRDYAATSPEEDFAEAIAYYVGEPHFLKRKCPKTYAFVKDKVFEGEEYLERGPQGQTHQIIASDPNFKQCINANYQGALYLDGKLELERISFSDGHTHFDRHSPIELGVKEECLSKLKAKLRADSDEKSCSLRESPQDLDSVIANAFEKKYGDEFRELVTRNYSPEKLERKIVKCWELKDLRPSCLFGDMKAAVKNEGFSAPSLTRYRGEFGNQKLKLLGFNSKNALVSCVGASARELKKYLKRKNNSASCWWEVTKVFKSNGFKFQEDDIVYSFKDAVFDEDNIEALNVIKKDILDQGKEGFAPACLDGGRSCVELKVTNKLRDLGFEKSDAERLSKAIYGAF